jgi:hypothetical protein
MGAAYLYLQFSRALHSGLAAAMTLPICRRAAKLGGIAPSAAKHWKSPILPFSFPNTPRTTDKDRRASRRRVRLRLLYMLKG